MTNEEAAMAQRMANKLGSDFAEKAVAEKQREEMREVLEEKKQLMQRAKVQQSLIEGYDNMKVRIENNDNVAERTKEVAEEIIELINDTLSKASRRKGKVEIEEYEMLSNMARFDISSTYDVDTKCETIVIHIPLKTNPTYEDGIKLIDINKELEHLNIRVSEEVQKNSLKIVSTRPVLENNLSMDESTKGAK